MRTGRPSSFIGEDKLSGRRSLHVGVNSPERTEEWLISWTGVRVRRVKRLRAGPCTGTIWRLTQLFSPVSCRERCSNKSCIKQTTGAERSLRGVISLGFISPALFCSGWVTVAVCVWARNQSASPKIADYPPPSSVRPSELLQTLIFLFAFYLQHLSPSVLLPELLKHVFVFTLS